MVTSAFAALDVKLVSYKASTQDARILISNTGKTDYTRIVLYIDGTPTEMKGTVLKGGTGFLIPKKIYPGEKNISVKTDQGYFSKMMYFSQPAPISKVPVEPMQNNIAIAKKTVSKIDSQMITLGAIFGLLIALVIFLIWPRKSKPVDKLYKKRVK